MKQVVFLLIIFAISLNASNSKYRCDGREHCSQMKSCDEAKFFLKNCPNTKMDGDNDGIPCENQFCTSKKKKDTKLYRNYTDL
jgi:hypothetical protein